MPPKREVKPNPLALWEGTPKGEVTREHQISCLLTFYH